MAIKTKTHQTDQAETQTDQAETQTDQAETQTVQAETQTVQAETQTVQAETGLDLDFIESGAFTLTPELTSQAAPQRARSDKQRKMDAVVERLHKHWKSVGGPSQWGKLVETKCVTTYFVQPDQAAELKKLINRAGAFHDVAIRYGSSFLATEHMVKKFNLPEAYVGREVISFAARDRRPRAANGTKGTTQAETKSE